MVAALRGGGIGVRLSLRGLRADGADTALGCTIAGSATSCTDVADDPLIPAVSTLSLEGNSSLTVLSSSLLVRFETH